MSSLRNLIDELAGAIADKEPIDWNVVEGRASGGTQTEIRHLQAISRIASARPSDRLAGEHRERAQRGSFWIHAWFFVLVLVASSHVVVAFVGFLLNPLDDRASSVPPLAPVVNMVAYWIIGGLLVIGGRGRDRRALYLGAFFIVAASPLAVRFLPAMASIPPWLWWWRTLYPEAFMPFLLWLFVRDFPRLGHFTRYHMVTRWLTICSAVAGVILCLANVLKSSNVEGPWASLSRSATGPYWAIIFALELAALAIVVLRARMADRDEHHRVGLFLGGLVVGGSPILLQVLLTATIPAYFAWLAQPNHLYVATLVVYGFAVIVPLTSAYAVLVGKLFDLRPIVRRALQYALARYTVLAFTGIPVFVVCWYVFTHRNDPGVDLFSSRTVLVGAGLAGCGVLLTRAKGRLLAWTDRRFFRPDIDSRTALMQIGAQMVQAGGIREVANLVVEHVTRALGVDQAAVLTRRAEQPAYIPLSGACRPLPLSSALVAVAEVATSPVNLDLDADRSLYHLLPPDDKEWVVDASCAVMMPIRPSRQPYAALLLVGPKRSDLPFDRDDHLFLESVAASAALGFDNAGYRETASNGHLTPSDWKDEAAAECTACGVVQVWDAGRVCLVCGGALTSAALPGVLLGKFKVERVIGRGGMGVVYLAEDMALGRQVAMKTLPRVSLDQIKRLRGEARAMAAVTHSNLAVIYGAETWRGTPLLIVEYLPGGTLAHRLLKGALGLEETVALGEAMAGALDRMHGVGMMHLDVKPSNVGFAEDGTPKLLDFGLARLLEARAGASESRTPFPKLPKTARADAVSTAANGSTHLRGTPLYLSPEAIAGASPDTLFDLWSLAVMLFEALTGANPFRGTSIAEVFSNITRVDPDRLCQYLDGHPQPVRDFFQRSLASDRHRRVETAMEMRRELTSLKEVRQT